MMRQVTIKTRAGVGRVQLSDVDPIEVLHRLKRRFARERARLERQARYIIEGPSETYDALASVKLQERAYQCIVLSKMLDEEIRKAKGPKDKEQ